jgi:hypothetical protein
MFDVLASAEHLIEQLTYAAMAPETLGSNDWLVDWKDFPRPKTSAR